MKVMTITPMKIPSTIMRISKLCRTTLPNIDEFDSHYNTSIDLNDCDFTDRISLSDTLDGLEQDIYIQRISSALDTPVKPSVQYFQFNGGILSTLVFFDPSCSIHVVQYRPDCIEIDISDIHLSHLTKRHADGPIGILCDIVAPTSFVGLWICRALFAVGNSTALPAQGSAVLVASSISKYSFASLILSRQPY